MSTPPIVPKPAAPTTTPFEKWLAFFRAHERFATIVILALVTWYAYGKYINYADKHATAAEQVAFAKAASDKQAADQSQQTTQLLIAQVASLQAAVTQAMSQRAVAVQQQQKADQTLPLPDVGRRISTLAGFDSAANLTMTNGGIQFNEPAARETAQALEQLPALKQDNADLQNLNKQGGAALASCKDTVTKKDAQITSDNTAHATEVAKLKDDAKKGKMKWFKIGFVSGLATRGLIKIFAGV